MRSTTWVTGWRVAVLLAISGSGCTDSSRPGAGMTSPVTVGTLKGPALVRVAASNGPVTLQSLRARNPVRWVGDSVQSVIRNYRTDYVARRKAKLPLKGLCEGLLDYFTTRNAWGRSLAVGRGRLGDLLSPQCSAPGRKIRFFSTAFSKPFPEGQAYVTDRSMALLDSLQQITARVDAANRSAAEAVSMLTAGIDRIETLAANSSLTDQEYELVVTTTSGLTGAIAEGQAMLPAVLQDVSNAVEDCAQRLGYLPDDPSACDQEVYEVLGPMSYQVPRPVLMCALALHKAPAATPRPPCDGHEIIEGIAYGFIGGAVGGAWAGLVGTGGLGVPLTALLGGIGGAASGLAVGLAKSFWCEMQK